MNKSSTQFDFLFVGLGAANCLLILRLHNSGLLMNKNIAIIEPDSKSSNDRTFCFWATADELLKLNLEKLVSYSWDTIEISGINKEQIKPHNYYHIKGIDLYNETKNILNNQSVTIFTTFLKENPKIKSTGYEISLENETIYANKVFDCRPPSYLTPQKNQSHLYQSFYGWKIKTITKAFDVSTMVMMDFNIPQNNATQFIYILPYNDDTALIELTRFGDHKILKDEATLILNNYIKALGVSFEVLDEEQGVIPMSSANMKIDDFGPNWVNMGVKANMLKGSTGYAFHAMAEDALVQMEAIKNNQQITRKNKKQRFGFYDRLLLKILNEKPENGKIIFETLFKKVPVAQVLSFMREKTKISEEILIFSKLPRWLFIKTAVKDLFHQVASLPVLVMPFLFTIFTLILSLCNFEFISGSILLLGFLSVGLSHGALDHLTSKKIINKKELSYFVVKYLLKSILLGLVWLVFPDLALFIFIAYSAWHFGEADFKEWGLKQGLQSLLWGTIVLMAILFFHIEELNLILKQIPNSNSANLLKEVSKFQIVFFQISIVAIGCFLAVINKSKFIFLTLLYLLISSMLPLLISFGIYFVGQHSVHGWRHLSKGLNETSYNLWLKSLPFSIGGTLLIIYFLLFAGLNYVGFFFIILSCLSLPHVFSMNRFYLKLNNQ